MGPGTYIASIELPQGAQITALRLSARDNDTDKDAHAYLVRKLMVPKSGVDGFDGYTLLTGDEQRRVDGPAAVLHQHHQTPGHRRHEYAYLAEIVDCVNTVDPIGVQVVWTKG